MKTQKFRSFEAAGITLPDITVEAVVLNGVNFDDVAQWCGGTKHRHGVLVPVSVMTGDSNKHHPLGRGLKKTKHQTQALTGDYVVKWGDDFFVVAPMIFTNTYKPLA